MGYLKFLFSPYGRISRSDIWIKYLLPLIGLSIVAGIIDAIAFPQLFERELGPVSNILSLFYLWPGIAVPVKRFHDRGMTGWTVLVLYLVIIFGAALAILPLALWGEYNTSDLISPSALLLGIGLVLVFGALIYWFIENYCLPGRAGPNKYGPDPLAPGEHQVEAFS